MSIDFDNLEDYALHYALPQIDPSAYPGSRIQAWLRRGEHFKILVAIGALLAFTGVALTIAYNQSWMNMTHFSGWVHVFGLVMTAIGLSMGYYYHYNVNKSLNLLILQSRSVPLDN